MKVLIANPAYHRQFDGGIERILLGSGIRFPWSMLKHQGQRPRFAIFPMFLGYTAALLERAGHEVYALDAVPIDLHEQDFIDRVKSLEPDIVVFEPNSAVIDDVLRTATTVKTDTGATIVMAGTHVTAEFRPLLEQNNAIDFIVRGEFEYGVLDLVQALSAGENSATLVGSFAGSLAGVVCRDADGKAPIEVDVARSVDDLNALPLPARHLFPAWFDNNLTAYHDGFYQASPAFDVHATRGCPYSCNFCAWVHVLYQNGSQRLRSPAAVVDEMETLVNHYGAREIYFDDDNFSANRKFVNALCDELIARGKPVHWSALTDAIALNNGLLQRMAEAGCIGIKFGLDSADSEVLRNTQKPLKVARVAGIVDTAKRLGIKTHMTVVLGLAGETQESLERTFQFACDLDIDSVQISIATPMPGTPLFDELKSTQQLQFKRWDELDGYASSVIRYQHFRREYIENFVASAHTRWLHSRLRRPRWVLRQMRYLWRLGANAGFKGVVRRGKRFYRLVTGDSTAVLPSTLTLQSEQGVTPWAGLSDDSSDHSVNHAVPTMASGSAVVPTMHHSTENKTPTGHTPTVRW